MTLVALAGLWLATGFGATVWSIIAVNVWKQGRRWRAFWTIQIAVADLVAAFIVGARLINRPFDVPLGISTLLLLPIILLPAAIRLNDWIVSRRALSRVGDRLKR
jgi:hypothetical protein